MGEPGQEAPPVPSPSAEINSRRGLFMDLAGIGALVVGACLAKQGVPEAAVVSFVIGASLIVMDGQDPSHS